MKKKSNEESVISQKIDTIIKFSKEVLALRCFKESLLHARESHRYVKSVIPSVENISLMLDQVDTKIRDLELSMHRLIKPLFGQRNFKVLTDIFRLNSHEIAEGYVLLAEENEKGDFKGNSILFLKDIFDRKAKKQIRRGEIHPKGEVHYLLKHLKIEDAKVSFLAKHLITLKTSLFNFKKLN